MTLFKLLDQVAILLIVEAGARADLALRGRYQVILTEPTLSAFQRQGPLTIAGPQKAVVISSLNELPQAEQEALMSYRQAGTYREVLPTVNQAIVVDETALRNRVTATITKTESYKTATDPD